MFACKNCFNHSFNSRKGPARLVIMHRLVVCATRSLAVDSMKITASRSHEKNKRQESIWDNVNLYDLAFFGRNPGGPTYVFNLIHVCMTTTGHAPTTHIAALQLSDFNEVYACRISSEGWGPMA